MKSTIRMLCCFLSSSGVETIGNKKPMRCQTLTMTAVVMTKSMLKQEQAREQLQENDNIVLFLPVMWSR